LYAIRRFHGVRNGKKIGIMLNIVVKDAETLRI